MVSVCDNGDERGGWVWGRQDHSTPTANQLSLPPLSSSVQRSGVRGRVCRRLCTGSRPGSRQSRDGARAGCGAPGKLPGRVVLAARDSNKDEKKTKQTKHISEEVRVSGFHSFAYLCHFSLYLVNTCTRAQVDGKDILHCWRNLVTCELLHLFLFGSTIAVRTKYEVPLVYVDDR